MRCLLRCLTNLTDITRWSIERSRINIFFSRNNLFQVDYSLITVGGAVDYVLDLEGFSSPPQWLASNGFEENNPLRFSTYEQDLDTDGDLNCAENYTSAGW